MEWVREMQGGKKEERLTSDSQIQRVPEVLVYSNLLAHLYESEALEERLDVIEPLEFEARLELSKERAPKSNLCHGLWLTILRT